MKQDVRAHENPETDKMRRRGQPPQGSLKGLVVGYRFSTRPAYPILTIDHDFSLAASSPHGEGVARHSVSWRPARDLRRAANVLEAAGNQPGARVRVVVGRLHKAYDDAYLDQMQDRELINIDVMLRG
jgi:hypothetical protein